ncbi:MAG: hypothetical protein D6806_13680, partial [Deltaproteobacteria bacterium]
MIVTCEKCSTKFKLADEKITPKGVKVRCSKCQHVFVVKKDHQEASKLAGPPAGTTEGGTSAPALPPQPGIGDDDIFSQPTRVAPSPNGAAKAGGLPAVPPSTSTAGSDDGFPVPAPVPPPLPQAAKQPPAKGQDAHGEDAGFDLGSDLFKDLDDFEIPPPPAGGQSTPPPELFPPSSVVVAAGEGVSQPGPVGGAPAELPREAGLISNEPKQAPSPATAGSPQASQPPTLPVPPMTSSPARQPPAALAPQPPGSGAKSSKDADMPAIPG